MNKNNSTGPRSEIGKQTSSRNAIKNGCRSNETFILPTENVEDFQALEAARFEASSPKGDLEAHLLNQVIQPDWFLQRATRPEPWQKSKPKSGTTKKAPGRSPQIQAMEERKEEKQAI
jgi:hypothetical protein